MICFQRTSACSTIPVHNYRNVFVLFFTSKNVPKWDGASSHLKTLVGLKVPELDWHVGTAAGQQLPLPVQGHVLQTGSVSNQYQQLLGDQDPDESGSFCPLKFFHPFISICDPLFPDALEKAHVLDSHSFLMRIRFFFPSRQIQVQAFKRDLVTRF